MLASASSFPARVPRLARKQNIGKLVTPPGVAEIFELIRTAVTHKRLAPGTQLKEQALATAFNVNRAVIRQVLAKLQSCRLVDHQPNRGVFVATPSLDEGRAIFQARRVIESAIVVAAVEQITSVGIKALKKIVAQEHLAYRSGKLRKGLALSTEFHRSLARSAGNLVLEQFLEELIARSPLVVLTLIQANTASCEHDEHDEIVAAIEARDANRAERLVKEHLCHLEQQLAAGESFDIVEQDIATILGLVSAPS